jgi:hypothetical protein
MRSPWLKWLLVFAVLLLSSGGNAHALADHAAPRAKPCAAHDHHAAGADHHKPHAAGHQDCCCSCFSSPSGLVTPVESVAPIPVAYDLHLTPARASPLAERFISPELDPPRPGTPS